MLNILNKYRSFLHSLLLASYLLSVFQVPIFELFHLLSHTYHHISYSKTEFHSYNYATSLNNTISSFKKNSNNFGNPTEPIKFYRTLVVPPPELF